MSKDYERKIKEAYERGYTDGILRGEEIQVSRFDSYRRGYARGKAEGYQEAMAHARLEMYQKGYNQGHRVAREGKAKPL